MKQEVLIKSYSEEYKKDLERLLSELSKEVFGFGTADIEQFLNYHWAVYLAIVNKEVVGFSSFIYNTYFGLRPPTIGNTYLYVIPEYRGTKVNYLLSIQAGKVCIDAGLPLEHYYASEESKKLSRKLSGKKAYETYVYEVDEIRRVFEKLISKVRITE